MAIPPQGSTDPEALQRAIQSLESDVFAFQEVDHFLPRSNSRPQMRDIAESIAARDWAMGPSVIGTPGESWRKKHEHEPEIITNASSHSELMHETYGIGIVSKIPVLSWHRLNLGNSPLGLPLIVPGDETGKGRPRFIYVKDEPRLALAAVLENGYTVVNTHLSFVPGFNLAQLRRVKKWALEIAESTGKIIVATYGVAAVGINIPRVFNLVLIEPGKSFVRVIQSIGRGIRKAEDKDHVEIWDITSTCKFAKRHLTKRKVFYRDANYPFSQEKLEWK